MNDLKYLICFFLSFAINFPIKVFAAEFNLTFQTIFVKNTDSFKEAKRLVKLMEDKTNSRVKIELLPINGMVRNTESLDAIRLGLLDGHISFGGYFAEKAPEIALLANTVGAWSDEQQLIRFMKEGGSELYDKALSKHQAKLIGTYTLGAESFVSSKATSGTADLRGLRIRVADDLTKNIFVAFGAKPVKLSLNQIRPSLEQNLIDAADATSFATNQSIGLNDVAPHPVYPGFYSIPFMEVSISLNQWTTLPTDVQSELKKAVEEYSKIILAESKQNDVTAVEEAKRSGKIIIHDWPEEEHRKFREVAKLEWQKYASRSTETKEVYDALVLFLKDNQLL